MKITGVRTHILEAKLSQPFAYSRACDCGELGRALQDPSRLSEGDVDTDITARPPQPLADLNEAVARRAKF